MVIPLRATNYKLSQKWPSKIILHHTACQLSGFSDIDYDKPIYQVQKYHDINYRLKKEETKFHFIVDRYKNDYQIVASQPLMTLCEFSDLTAKDHRAIHVAFLGDYNSDMPMTRMYKAVAYRLLIPMMRLFLLKTSDIVFHSTVSNEDNLGCPGEFISMDKIHMNIKSLMRRGALAKSK